MARRMTMTMLSYALASKRSLRDGYADVIPYKDDYFAALLLRSTPSALVIES